MLPSTTKGFSYSPVERRLRIVQFHAAFFAAAMIAWTISLLMPVPKESASKVLGSDENMFWFGKSLHVGAYGFLTLVGLTISRKWSFRWWIVGFMLFHGAATEFLQQFVDRGASARDIALDWLGVWLATAFVWYWVVPSKDVDPM